MHHHDHTPQAIAERLTQKPSVSYLREWVYGGIDGVVTTFAVVAGVAGADLPVTVILIIALANLLGDGFSMAAGCYSGARTEEDNYKRLYEFENQSIKNNPEGEKEEIRQIFKAKGFKGDILENIVDTIADNKKIWLDTMMVEEHGLAPNHRRAGLAALHTFAAFFVCGAMPVLPFIFGTPHAFVLSMLLSGLTFFGIGALKSLWSQISWWWYGAETLAIGGTAAAIAYGTGYGLKLLIM